MGDETILATSGQVALIIRATLAMDEHDVSAWLMAAIENERRHDTVTAMLDPTAYMRDRAAVDAASNIASAFATWHRACRQNRNPEADRG